MNALAPLAGPVHHVTTAGWTDGHALARYEQACSVIGEVRHALAEAAIITDVTSCRAWAEAVRAGARQAGNRGLEIDAAELRLWAERRLGELLELQRGTIGLAPGKRTDLGDRSSQVDIPTYRELGIHRNLASRGRRYAALPVVRFEQLLADRRERIEGGAKRVSLDILDDGGKAERRAAREAELGARQCAWPARRYGVIVADPEWEFKARSERGMDRAAANHYPTSPTAAIAARPVGDIAADDCVLFLWATAPMLPDALRVLDAWGFAYRTNAVWAKDRVGTGYWFRSRHEHLLLGLRGTVPCPAPGTQWESVVQAPVGRHSQKPERFLELVEAYFPTLPKIELNRRGPARPGWDAWGNEAVSDAVERATCAA